MPGIERSGPQRRDISRSPEVRDIVHPDPVAVLNNFDGSLRPQLVNSILSPLDLERSEGDALQERYSAFSRDRVADLVGLPALRQEVRNSVVTSGSPKFTENGHIRILRSPAGASVERHVLYEDALTQAMVRYEKLSMSVTTALSEGERVTITHQDADATFCRELTYIGNEGKYQVIARNTGADKVTHRLVASFKDTPDGVITKVDLEAKIEDGAK
jgi:hypothetical protein